MEKNEKSFEGKLLVASPHLDDPYFRHALIYVCTHDKSGAIGVIVNQKIGMISYADFMVSHNRDPKRDSIKNKKFPLLFGGPVNTDMLLAISMSTRNEKAISTKRNAEKINKSNIMIHTDVSKFFKDIAVGKSKETISKFILAKGISAWDGQQLETEVAENTWFVMPASLNIIFSQGIKNKWNAVIKQLGIVDFASLVQYSGNA